MAKMSAFCGEVLEHCQDVWMVKFAPVTQMNKWVYSQKKNLAKNKCEKRKLWLVM